MKKLLEDVTTTLVTKEHVAEYIADTEIEYDSYMNASLKFDARNTLGEFICFIESEDDISIIEDALTYINQPFMREVLQSRYLELTTDELQ